jgi:hypothetical protein
MKSQQLGRDANCGHVCALYTGTKVRRGGGSNRPSFDDDLIGDFLGMGMAADSRIATARSPQGPAANTGSGSAALTNPHITVVPGASVSGPIIGIAFLY